MQLPHLKHVSLCLTLALVPSGGHSRAPRCNVWDVEYTLDGRLRVSDTFMGAGNGEHDIGPGKLLLRFDDVAGQPGGNVEVRSYEMTNRFTIDATVLGVRTTVINDTTTRATPDRRGVVSVGAIGEDGLIRWSGPWYRVQTDGHLTCSGVCGRFGAPPRGRSELHLPPRAVTFMPFTFAPKRTTFHMDYAVIDKTSADTARVAVTGRETARRCGRGP
jgi:hypothetical protein